MRRRDFQRLTRVDDATSIFLNAVTAIRGNEQVEVSKSVGRVLARRIVAGKYLPANNISVLDGYAVRSADLLRASVRNPAVLRLVGESRLGELSWVRVKKGETVAVATGSIIPKGANAVVMVEWTRTLSAAQVEFRSPVASGHGITEKGEDLRPGGLVLDRGSRLRPEDIGALKALGLTRVPVLRKPRVGVLSTGNELVNQVRAEKSAKIVDLNRPILTAMLRELGAIPVDLGIVRDDARTIKGVLKAALASTDVVLVTAGSSVGERDLVPSCINSLGKPGMIVHGVAMRPAMPTGVAVIKGKPVVSLPGFPVSAMIAFRVFVRPLLAKIVGSEEFPEPILKAKLKGSVRRIEGCRTYVRVRVKKIVGGFVAVPLESQRSSLLTSIVHANGIVTIPESVPSIEAGTEVAVTLTGSLAT